MSKHAGFGAQIYLVEGGAKTLIPGLRGDPVLAEEQAEQIEVTAHDSPGGRREYLGGLIDTVERTLEFYYDPDEPTHQTLRSSVRQTLSFEVDHPVFAQPEQFDAVVMNAQVTAELEGGLVLSVTLKPTGEQVSVSSGGGGGGD